MPEGAGPTVVASLVVGVGLNSRATADDVISLVDVAVESVERTRADVLTIVTAEHRRGHVALAALPWPVDYLPSDQFAGRDVAQTAARLRSAGGMVIVPKRCTDCVCVAIAKIATSARSQQVVAPGEGQEPAGKRQM